MLQEKSFDPTKIEGPKINNLPQSSNPASSPFWKNKQTFKS